MKHKALVFDDDILNLNFVREFLSDKRFDVTGLTRAMCPMISQDLDECPCTISPYNIILSDNDMPAMKGIEFFKHIEQRGCKIARSHKALLSGGITAEEQERADKLGVKVFLKPCSLEELDLWIDEVCGSE